MDSGAVLVAELRERADSSSARLAAGRGAQRAQLLLDPPGEHAEPLDARRDRRTART